MAMNILVLLALVGVVLLVARRVHLALFSPLAKIPNAHPLAPWTGLYMLWLRYSENVNRNTNAAHEKYGPLVRLGPSELAVNCVDEGTKTIYGSRHFMKHPFYLIFSNFGATPMFSTIDNTYHGIKRKRVSNVYSKSYLQTSADMRAIVDDVMFQRFLPRLSNLADSGKDFDIMRILQAVTLDLATSYVWGLRNGTKYLIDEPKHEEFLEMYFASRPTSMFFMPIEMPNITKFLARFGWSPLPKDAFYFNDTTDAWCLEMCDEADADLASGETLKPGYNPVVYRQMKESVAKEDLSPIPALRAYRTSPLNFRRHRTLPADTEKLVTKLRSSQQVDIAAELLDEMVATNDVLGNTLSYIYWELSRNPDVQKQLRDEVLEFSSSMAYTPGQSFTPDPKALDTLPMLHAVIMETMRRWPTNPGMEPRLTPPNTTLCGYTNIPAGVRVSAAPFCLHRDPEVYPEPETWRPQRWMPNVEDRGKWAGNGQAERYFFGFSSGLRMCIGNKLSMHFMKHVLAYTYANFKTTIVDDTGMEEQHDGFLAAMDADQLILKIERWT